MADLIERDIFASFIGKTVNHETCKKPVRHNGGNNYLICNADYKDDPQLRETFGITDRLKEVWEYSGVDFTICLTVEEGIITEGHIYKCREGGGGHGRPVVRPLKETQQEMRVARRILAYITK